jgi:AAA+ superfamily predicted ATPase
MKLNKVVERENNSLYSNPPYSSLDHVLDELQRINKLVTNRVKKWRKTHQNTEFLGLYVSDEEIDSLLAEEHAQPEDLCDIEAIGQLISKRKKKALQEGVELRLESFHVLFGLSQFEVDIALVALASELDLKYTKLFAYLQDDVTKKKPTVGLILSLFCKYPRDAVEARKLFSYDSKLVKSLIVRIEGDEVPLLERSIKLDERIVGFLLGSDELDPSVASFSELSIPVMGFEELTLQEDFKRQLLQVCEASFSELPVYLLQGSAGAFEAAQAFCSEANIPILKADLRRIKPETLEANVNRFFREAKLQKAAVYLDELDAVSDEVKATILAGIEKFAGAVFFSSKTDLSLNRKAVKIVLPNLTFQVRQKMWHSLLGDVDGADELAGKFRFGKNKAIAALDSARSVARMRNPKNPSLTLDDLYVGCKAQSNAISHASKINPRYVWGDIILPEDKKKQLREVCNYVKYYATVYESWGFDKHSRGKGLNVLFSGPSGTGKTMAAEIVSSDLKLDLYKIDLSMVVSKYIGETEKNLNKIFKDAEESNAVLFFDEADALFGKRSEVKDAHDRYANIEINYLLQKMEEHEGIAILATNMSKSIDDAFLRRMNFIVEFPFPTEEYRLAIWQKVFPEQTPLDKKIDYEFLSKLQISGGNIKNIALAAAFLAAETSGAVKMEHVAKAARREFEKIGKVYGKEEFGKYFNLVK